MKKLTGFQFDPRGLAVRVETGGKDGASASSADPKTITIRAGDYRTRFDAGSSWTMRSVLYRNQVINHSEGGTYLQSVLNESHGQISDGKPVDPFLGSGHRPEQVDSLEIGFYDGIKFLSVHELDPEKVEAFEIERGTTVIFKKRSRLVSAFNGTLIHLEHVTVIAPTGVEQYVRVSGGDGDLSKIAFLYPHMHILPNATHEYLAFHEGNIVEQALFKDDNSMSLRKEVTAIITWVPESNTGIHLYHTRSYPRGEVHIWNRAGDNKLYFRYPYPRARGEALEYALFFEAFPCKGVAAQVPPESGAWSLREFTSGKGTAQIAVKQ